MRYALGLVILLTACATTTPNAIQERTSSSLFNTARNSSVLVVTDLGHGSGVIINARCVLTVDHVVDGAQGINVVFNDHTSMPMTVSKADGNEDLALLCGGNKVPFPAVTVGTTPQIDDYVFAVGYPLSFNKVVTEGMYEDVDTITAQVAPGNSGGGAFDSTGKLVGLVDTIALYPSDRGIMDFPHLCGIVGVTAINNFLKG